MVIGTVVAENTNKGSTQDYGSLVTITRHTGNAAGEVQHGHGNDSITPQTSTAINL